MDELEAQARGLALDDADEAVAQWFAQRLDSRRPKPKQPEAPPPPASDVDLEARAGLISQEG